MNTKKHKLSKEKKPWPTKRAMQQVYEQQLWGSGEIPFYSGEGSHHAHIVQPYLVAVSSFLQSLTPPPVVCDLGCGDFNIGKELSAYSDGYIGIDIVPELIEYNILRYTTDRVQFDCLDLAVDTLPFANCALLRQVLQHLSNKEIKAVVDKLPQYQYVILTEHIPNEKFEANKDIISGQGIRLKKKSGVDVLAPPFSLKPKKTQELNTVLLANNKGRIETVLYTMF